MVETGESPIPDIEDLWRQSVRDAPREEVERRPWVEAQVYREVRRARRGHSHMTAVTLEVLVAECMDCVVSEARALDLKVRPPSVYGSQWAQDYAALGFSRREIARVRDALRDGGWHPRCHQCGSSIDIQAQGFRVRRTDISDYFGLKIHEGRVPPAWMKTAILRAFGSRCAACKKPLTKEQTRFDHVVPASKGGSSQVTNLQVLCEPCNSAKADQDVESETVLLGFPLCPAPSDAFEGLTW
jgi:5-methylcytosine-specific restriction endonuclease McrA